MDGLAEVQAPTTGRRRRAGNGNIPIWFGPLFGMFGVIALVLGIGIVRDELRLSEEGVEAPATIQSLHMRVGTGDDADTFSIAYAFTAPDGRVATGRSQVDERTYLGAAVGDVVTISYLPGEPARNRLGSTAFQPFPSLLVVGVGLLFSLTGLALTLTAVRQRGRSSQAAAIGQAPDPAAVHRFTRSPMRIVVDLFMAPLGALAFLGVAGWLVIGSGDVTYMLAGVVFGFFGLLMASGAVVTLRRGLRATLLEVGPAGIWTPELGRRSWSEIAEIRVESSAIATGSSRRRASGYRRLGIVPRDAALGASAPGGIARGLTSGFFRFATLLRPGARVPDIDALAPFGVAEYELEQPLDTLIPYLAPFVRVVDLDGSVLGSVGDPIAVDDALVAGSAPTPASGSPRQSSGGPSDPVLAGLLAGSGAPFMAGPTPTAGVARPPSLVAMDRARPEPRTAIYRRRDAAALGAVFDVLRAGLFLALPIAAAVVFGAVSIADGGLGSIFVIVPLAMAALFVMVGLPALLEAIGRLGVGLGAEEALVIDELGIAMTGMGRLTWDEVAEARIGRADVVEDGESGSIVRPRLEIVPRDVTRLDARPWATRARDVVVAFRRRLQFWSDGAPPPGAFTLGLDQLAADPDEVIDLIATYRVVDEE